MVEEIGQEAMTAVVEGEAEARIVDVRSPASYRREHVPGSENVPLQQLVQDVERFAGADRVVTLCPHGQASQKAARLIAAYEEFDGVVQSFEPGLTGYEGPTTSADAAADGGPDDDQPRTASPDEGPDAPF